MNQVIRSLWIGPKLSILQQLSISSFLAMGHTYHLYVYGDVESVPSGTVIKDANMILPSSTIFQYTQYPSYAGFANYFRYKLLLETGGWWADSDVVCLRPFDFSDGHIFSSQMSAGKETATSCVIKVPPQSELMAYACRVCEKKKPAKLVWGETGPRLMSTAIEHFSLEQFMRPFYAFCPIHYVDWEEQLNPEKSWSFDSDTYAVHLWNEMWRRSGRDQDRQYDPRCLYETLKRRYLDGRKRSGAGLLK